MPSFTQNFTLFATTPGPFTIEFTADFAGGNQIVAGPFSADFAIQFSGTAQTLGPFSIEFSTPFH